MLAVEESKNRIPIEGKDKSMTDKREYQYRVRPRYSIWNEGNKMILEVILPGVPKDQIKVKGLKDYIMISAIRDAPLKNQSEIGKILYSLDLPLEWEIIPEKTKTKYTEGLLHVEMHLFNPLEQSHIVSINNIKPDIEKLTKVADDTESYVSFPEITRDVNYETKSVDIEVSIPGVKQENILLRILPDTLDLIAKRDMIIYRANFGFGVVVIPEKTTATYSDGLLKIHANFKERLDDAREIKL